jgi:UDP-N-acetylglucosamine 3-dehydrogenase
VADLRAGLIGLGVMGQNHARILSSLPGVTLTGIVEPFAASSPRLSPSYAPIFSSVEDLLKEGVDYCFVAVPTEAHVDVGLQLAKSGVHALIEKPLAADSAGAIKLTEAFTHAGLVGAVGHIERYNPALQQARSRLANGDLGEIYQVLTRRQGPFPARIADVGVVKDLATHDIDLTSWVAQRSYISVAAQTAHRAGRKHEDLVTIIGELEGGIIANHTVNWLSPFKERQTVVTGELGAFVADMLTGDLTFHANGVFAGAWDDVSRFRGVREGDVTRFSFPKHEPLRTEHEVFRDAVLGQPVDIVTMHQGCNTVRIADAVLESARLGKVIKIGGNC